MRLDLQFFGGRGAKATLATPSGKRTTTGGNKIKGIEVVTPDGVKLSYRERKTSDGRTVITGIDDTDINDAIPSNWTLNDIIQRMRDRGATVTEYSVNQLDDRDSARARERATRPDYEFNLGTPWGNKENRRGARRAKINTRVQRRRG